MNTIAGIVGEVTPISWDGVKMLGVAGHFDPQHPGVGAQFLQGAEAYDDQYFRPEAVQKKIVSILAAAGLDLQPKRILDLGSGTGNSIVSMAKLWPGASILATDISPAMVSILDKRIAHYGLGDRVSAVVMDASKAALASGAFDLIVGSSMLHHLHDPFAVVDVLLRSLAPGGAAMFFEPFQPGNFMVRQAMLELMRASKHETPGFSPEAYERLRMLVDGISVVSSQERTDPRLPGLDDKWLFTKSQFEDAARRAGARVTIRHANEMTRTFQDRVAALFGYPLPEWAQDILRSYDEGVSFALREDLLLEGSIVFAKP